MIVISDNPNKSKLEIDLLSLDSDAYVSVRIESGGYSGGNDLYVLDGVFRNFCNDLVSLQKTLKGEAVLTSISPEEMDIVIRPFDSLGHISVAGKIGHHVYTAHSSNWHSVEFGFEVDPQELDRAVKVGWVKEGST